MTNDLEKRIEQINIRPYTKECTNSILKEILIELIVLNNKVQALFEEG